MRSHRRFNPAMLKMLERKRVEKRALENSRQFVRAPERWLKSAFGPDARQANLVQDDDMFFRDPLFRLPPEGEHERAVELRNTARPNSVATPAARTTKHYAALHAEVDRAAKAKEAKTRRKKATAIDGKRLKLAVERVRKPQPEMAPSAHFNPGEPPDHWFGSARRPAFDLAFDGGQ